MRTTNLMMTGRVVSWDRENTSASGQPSDRALQTQEGPLPSSGPNPRLLGLKTSGNGSDTLSLPMGQAGSRRGCHASCITHGVCGLTAPGGIGHMGRLRPMWPLITPACLGACPFSPRLPLRAEECRSSKHKAPATNPKCTPSLPTSALARHTFQGEPLLPQARGNVTFILPGAFLPTLLLGPRAGFLGLRRAEMGQGSGRDAASPPPMQVSPGTSTVPPCVPSLV